MEREENYEFDKKSIESKFQIKISELELLLEQHLEKEKENLVFFEK